MNIKELAEEAGMHYRKSLDEFCEADTDGVPLKMMTRFAELVAAAASEKEREACAELAENIVSNKGYVQASYVARAIRARGDA